jgi:glycosyl-4,4'-diaponeurosporenoate acyltransferase
MPIFHVDLWLLIILNTAAWLFLQLGLAFLFTRMPLSWFRPASFPFAPLPFEKGGALWNRLFSVKVWMGKLPSGAALTGSFSMKRLGRRDAAYFTEFAHESCRAEATHLCALFLVPLFALFNPPWAMIVHGVYALAANLPCLLAQRVNRPRFMAAARMVAARSGHMQ